MYDPVEEYKQKELETCAVHPVACVISNTSLWIGVVVFIIAIFTLIIGGVAYGLKEHDVGMKMIYGGLIGIGVGIGLGFIYYKSDKMQYAE